MKYLLFLAMTLAGLAQAADYVVPAGSLHLRGDVTHEGTQAIAGALEAGISDHLVIDSLGGNFQAAVHLGEVLDRLRAQGRVITCVSQSRIASAAWYIFLKCHQRVATHSTQVFFHEIVSGNLEGESPQYLREYAAEMDTLQAMWDKMAARTLGMTPQAYTRERLKKLRYSADNLKVLGNGNWMTVVDRLVFAGLEYPKEEP